MGVTMPDLKDARLIRAMAVARRVMLDHAQMANQAVNTPSSFVDRDPEGNRILASISELQDLICLLAEDSPPWDT